MSPELVPARLVRGARGAVASPHHLASQAGIGILRAGGSAVDAAIATNAALAVVTAHSCGLGGDAFWLIWDGADVVGLNGSGRSARGATIDGARAVGLHEMPLYGPWTVTVPGAISSWAEAHARFGRMPWPALLEPAAELADGFAASDAWCAAVERSARVFGADGDWARIYRPHGRPWQVGERVSLPALARTLRTLADEGPDAAYTGVLAARAAAYLEAQGSPLRAADFAAHRSDWTQPIAIDYRGATSVSHPPNSCGPLALEMLGLLERFDPPVSPDEPRWIHLGLEAARIALADRDALLTDADFMADGAVERLLDQGRLDRLAAGISLDRAGAVPQVALAGGGTIHLAAADGDGMLVSLLESNYMGFGAGLVDPQTGISYQNRGSFFRLDPDHPNALGPAKRTVHTLTPGILLRDCRPWIAHGSMGGEIQPQVFAQFVAAIVDSGLDIAAALALPRWSAHMEHHLGPPVVSLLEGRFDESVGRELERLGHRVAWTDPFSSALGHANAVELLPSGNGAFSLAAATDPRTEGAAVAW